MLCGLGALAVWAGSEAVLPAYIAGMVLAKTVGRDHFYIRRLRTLTIGFLTPFYFLPAGSLVSLPALASAPLVFLALFAGKSASKIFGLFPVIGRFRQDGKERWYYTLMMSTGLTFGTISALYGLTHKIVTPAAVFVPGGDGDCQRGDSDDDRQRRFSCPRHLLPRASLAGEEIPQLEVATANECVPGPAGERDQAAVSAVPLRLHRPGLHALPGSRGARRGFAAARSKASSRVTPGLVVHGEDVFQGVSGGIVCEAAKM